MLVSDAEILLLERLKRFAKADADLRRLRSESDYRHPPSTQTQARICTALEVRHCYALEVCETLTKYLL